MLVSMGIEGKGGYRNKVSRFAERLLAEGLPI